MGAAALVLSGGAVAASVWGPWRVIPDPHFAFERDWYSAAGELEGTCRSHWEFTLVRDEQTRDAALEILSELPIDDIDPDPEVLSKWYEIVGDGGLDEWGWTDLDIRQHALDQTVSNALLNEFERRGLDSSGLLLIRGEYQCSEVGAP